MVPHGLIFYPWCIFFVSPLVSELPRPIALKLCHMVGIWLNYIIPLQKLGGFKLLLTTNKNTYTRFRLVPKSMTLNDLWTRFKVIDSINAAKMAKYSLVMTPTPFVEWLDALRLLGLLIPWCTTYLLTCTVDSGHIKPAISPKRLKIKQKLLL